MLSACTVHTENIPLAGALPYDTASDTCSTRVKQFLTQSIALPSNSDTGDLLASTNQGKLPSL